jgi:hypothetical protein
MKHLKKKFGTGVNSEAFRNNWDSVFGIEEKCPCGADLSSHDEDHPGVCCDCFDAQYKIKGRDSS